MKVKRLTNLFICMKYFPAETIDVIPSIRDGLDGAGPADAVLKKETKYCVATITRFEANAQWTAVTLSYLYLINANDKN